jgi:hypothetical protein
MKSNKWFCGILAAALAFSLAGADIAAAACGGGVCGRGQGGGRGNCYTQAEKGNCPNYQPGQGRKRGQGRQQCRRANNCPNTQTGSTPATQPAPAPSN